MTYGFDATFIVQVEVEEARGHHEAVTWLRRAISSQARFALAPQVLAEFVHVVTDPARFERPLDVCTAIGRAEAWWTAVEMQRVYPNEAAVRLFHTWMREHRLGRKRVLDTLLAATYFVNGVTDVVTSNARDFAVFGVHRVSVPEAE